MTEEVVWFEGESVTCPDCGKSWADLWDYDWGPRDVIHMECPWCHVPLDLHQDISVSYGLSKPELKP